MDFFFLQIHFEKTQFKNESKWGEETEAAGGTDHNLTCLNFTIDYLKTYVRTLCLSLLLYSRPRPCVFYHVCLDRYCL